MFKKVIKKNNIRGLCIPLWLLLKLHSSEYIGTTCKFLCLEFRMFALCEYLKKYHSAYKREKGKERRDSSKKILCKTYNLLHIYIHMIYAILFIFRFYI